MQLIHDRAEEQFLGALEEVSQKNVVRHVLLCAFSQVPLTVNPHTVLPLLKDILDQGGELYAFHDGDMAVCWRGSGKRALEPVTAAFVNCYRETLETCDRERVFQFFDMYAHRETLKQQAQAKQQQRGDPVTATPPQAVPADLQWVPVFPTESLRTLRAATARRTARMKPEFLIVEDQDFSRRLLLGLFASSYLCHTARNAQEAVELYTEHAPDITFLDIELPDGTGHALAELFKKHDPDSYIVMVTANNYVKDVEAAKANKVEGFIIKPYNKQKIMGAVDVFLNRKKRKSV